MSSKDELKLFFVAFCDKVREYSSKVAKYEGMSQKSLFPVQRGFLYFRERADNHDSDGTNSAPAARIRMSSTSRNSVDSGLGLRLIGGEGQQLRLKQDSIQEWRTRELY